MNEQYAKPYLDSVVWIGWLKHEICNGVDRWRAAEHILRHAANGQYPIVVSSMTLAEVHSRRNSPSLTPDEDEQILSFFESEYIYIVDVDRLIGEQANRFCRTLGLKPFDAIHLACALRAKCDYLLTWDDRLLRCGNADIIIETPTMRGQHFLDLAPTDDVESK